MKMKIRDFVNILVIFILTGFVVGICWLQLHDLKSPWGLLFLPWSIFALLWGAKLNRDYE